MNHHPFRHAPTPVARRSASPVRRLRPRVWGRRLRRRLHPLSRRDRRRLRFRRAASSAACRRVSSPPTVEKLTVVSAHLTRARAQPRRADRRAELRQGAGRAHAACSASCCRTSTAASARRGRRINLAAFGFGSGPDSPFGDIPLVVGPFNVFDARVFLSQSVLDFGALNNARAEAHNVAAAQLTFKSARDFVVLVAGNLYLQALAASARADAARAQLETARALHQQAHRSEDRAASSPASTCCAPKCSSAPQTPADDHARQRIRESEAAAGARDRPAARPGFDARSRRCRTCRCPTSRSTRRSTRPTTRARTTWRRSSVSAPPKPRAQSIVGEALPSVHVDADYGALGLSPSDARATFAVDRRGQRADLPGRPHQADGCSKPTPTSATAAPKPTT